jgi:RNA-directed DNA polymerase
MSASNKFKNEFKANNLENIFSSSVKYNRSVGIDRVNIRVFERDLQNNISIIKKKSLNGTYRFSQYREKLLSRGADKCPRVISIPTIRDKITLKALFEIINSVYSEKTPFLHKIVNEVTASVSNGKYDGVLRLDVKDFYPSVRHDFLFKQLSKKIKNKRILHLIKNAVSQQTVNKTSAGKKEYIDTGIPQGLSISNVLANVYMIPIDQKYSKKTTIKFFRYVDDILILCKKKATNRFKEEIISDCKKIGLTIHDNPEKLCIGEICAGFNYLGYEFNDSIVTVRKKSLDKLRESIIKILTNYKYSDKRSIKLLSWTLNIRITGCIFNKTRYGWMFFFSQINDLQLLYSLDNFVEKQLIRFGLDPKKLMINKFIRTYHEINKNLNKSKYIPNFDLLTLKQKREILSDNFGVKAELMKADDIEYQFKRKIFRTIKDLEKDLARAS